MLNNIYETGKGKAKTQILQTYLSDETSHLEFMGELLFKKIKQDLKITVTFIQLF